MIPGEASHDKKGSKQSIGAITVALGLVLGALSCASPGHAQDDAKIKAGLEVWKSSGCPDCHGSFADGEETLPEDDRIGTFADREDADADRGTVALGVKSRATRSGAAITAGSRGQRPQHAG